jgi:hypothetical protein
MTTITDQATIGSIQAAYNSGNWQAAYQLVFNALTTETTVQDPSGGTVDQVNPSSGVDAAVWIWIAGAQKVNANSGPFAQYIRDYTEEQYLLRTGTQIGATDIQDASNIIAQRFIANMFGQLNDPNDPNASPPDQLLGTFSSLTEPNLQTIGQIDAGAAAARIFKPTTADDMPNSTPWAGTLLFTQLNDPSFFQDWVLTTQKNDFKKEAGTYQ